MNLGAHARSPNRLTEPTSRIYLARKPNRGKYMIVILVVLAIGLLILKFQSIRASLNFSLYVGIVSKTQES